MKTAGNAFMKIEPGEAWTLEAGGVLESGEKVCAKLAIDPVETVGVVRERYENVPLFQEQKWRAGLRFDALKAMECSLSYALLPDSVKIEDSNGKAFQNGVDYYFDAVWGAFGRTPDSRIGEGEAVYASYEYSPYRIDSIIVDVNRKLRQRKGQVDGPTPLPPALDPDETLIGNILFERNRCRLVDDMLFPFIEVYSVPAAKPVAEVFLSRTLAKLRAGKPVRILAWGDSVTACDFIRDERRRWINIFVEELRHRFPASEITLVNLGWPGKAVNTFLNEPPGSKYNYEERVVESGADMATLEFVNDAYLANETEFNRIYNRVRDDFMRKGIEPIIILPHPVRPDWMELPSQKGFCEDPRPYVKYLRRFARENHFALADVSGRFLHLWKEGVPYNSLMLNNINHPDCRGIKLYAEVLSSLFPGN